MTRPISYSSVVQRVQRWLDEWEDYPDHDLLLQILQTAMRLQADGAHRLDLKIINSALKELRYAAKVFAPYRNQPKVTMFGSARTSPEDPEYRQAAAFARKIVQRGFMVITGAGGGIMEAGHVGAGKKKSFGVNINLPFEQMANRVIRRDSKLITFKYFFTRKVVFIRETSAVVLFPGGFGTLDEGFETLTLLQTGKSIPMPVVFVDAPGGSYWKDWEEYVFRRILDRGMISPHDAHLFKITSDVDEAVEEVTNFYRSYHSSRYVAHTLQMRLRHEPDDRALEEANRRFGDILVEGRIEREPEGDPEFADLHVVRLRFNRRDFGRLRQLIDFFNAAAPQDPQGRGRPGKERRRITPAGPESPD
jgi:uncharacterized protein (TIGR00730 family)